MKPASTLSKISLLKIIVILETEIPGTAQLLYTFNEVRPPTQRERKKNADTPHRTPSNRSDATIKGNRCQGHNRIHPASFPIYRYRSCTIKMNHFVDFVK